MKSFSLAVILVCMAAVSALADVVTDQENVAPNGFGLIPTYVGDYSAQTFTVRNTGQLTSVALQLYFWWEQIRKPVTDDLHFRLTKTNAVGEPVVDGILATYDISAYDVTTITTGLPMFTLDLRDQHVHVQSDDLLALVISTNYAYKAHSERQYYVWPISSRDSIPGGAAYYYSPDPGDSGWSIEHATNSDEPWDYGYSITVDTVPEPSTAMLGALAIAASIILPHRPRRK